MKSVIAVDGPAASGKSTFARALGQKLGMVYINTGAMYRGVTWYLLKEKVALKDDVVEAVLQKAGIEAGVENGELYFRIGGEDPLPHVRDGIINERVSEVAALPSVRKLLISKQREMAEAGGLIMEGRDIGTVVLPQTPFKFFLDADPEVRAQRRAQQGEKDTITKRDRLDSTRASSPLKCADDALKVDTGVLSVEQIITLAWDHLKQKGFALPS